MKTRHVLAAAILLLAPGEGASTGAQAQTTQPEAPAELVGRLQIAGPPGRKMSLAGTVVWLPGVEASPAPSQPKATMASREKRFTPHVIAVPRGTTVTFPNADAVYHNVFSLAPGNAFDLGLYRKGASRSIQLKAPGLVRVYCNIHSDMAAYVLVVDGTAFAVTGEDGTYRITGIPPGRRQVEAWSEMGGERRAPLDFQSGQATTWDLVLDATSFQPEPHKNKHGKAYPPASKDVDRY